MSYDLVLYRRDGTCSFVPHALLNELNIPFKELLMKIEAGALTAANGSFSSAEYKSLTGSGFVPALKIDGEVVTEMPAVMTYITELAPERRLLGTSLIERAKAYQWMVWLSETLHGMGYGALWRPKRFTDDDSELVHKAIKDKGYRTILDCYEKIENRIHGSHAIGDQFTAVDLLLYNFWTWGSRIGLDTNEMSARYPNFTGLAKQVEKIESVRKTLLEEHMPLVFLEESL